MGSEASLLTPATLSGWLAYIEQLHSQAIDMGLERVRLVGERLAVCQPAPKVVLVAGTNGKGTTCAAIEQLLLAAGQRVAVYASPHLIHYNERLRIDGAELADDAHCRAFAAVEAARGDISLTYFEFGTLAALWLIQQAAVDVAVIEVGLGGRLDATNIVTPTLSLITTIDLDHQSFLGHDRDSVGREKAGIFRQAGVAVIGELDPPPSLLKAVADLNVDASWLGTEFSLSAGADHWQYRGDGTVIAALPRPAIPLANAAMAIRAFTLLGFEPRPELVASVMAGLKVAGRMQQLGDSPLRLVDVAHNPHAARYLAKELERLAATSGEIRAVVGVMADKDIAGIFAPLLPWVRRWWLVSPDLPRAASTATLRQLLPADAQVVEANSVAEGWQHATADADATDVVIGFGSFYTVAEILQAERDNCGQ